MAYNKNLYSSDTDALDAGIIYDQNELMMQDEINAAIKNGDLVVGMADNLASKMNQFSTGEFIERTTGGDASLSDGEGHLVLIRGNMVHEGYIAQSVDMTVTPIPRDPSAGEFTALIDDDAFIAEASSTSGTMVFTYGSSGWDTEPFNYGITVIGMPLPGDEISVVYQKEVRGTITQSDPQTFVSTGWNLYDHSKGYARALYYNDNPRFGITGTYSSVQYSLTVSGPKSSVTPDANGTFGIPQDGNGGYIWVNDGNDTDTAVWMCWSDWTTEANGGIWEAYSESEIDLSDIMTEYFPNGLMAVGAYRDEIDLSLGRVTNNVGRVVFSAENLDDIIELGVEYDYDGSYIYYGLSSPIVNTISIDNTVDAYDHGIEYFTGTSVPIYTQTLYGINLKNRLERDVVTISQQTLSASEQSQIATNLNVVKKTGDTMTGYLYIKDTANAGTDIPSATSYASVQFNDKTNEKIGAVFSVIGANNTGIRLQGALDGVTNNLNLYVSKNGERNVTVSDPVIWQDALNVVSRAGDTMTAALTIGSNAGNQKFLAKTLDVDITKNPSTTVVLNAYGLRDQNNVTVFYLRGRFYEDGRRGPWLYAINQSSDTNGLGLYVDADGNRTVDLAATPWRSALGLGTSGALPITIAQGGTGSTAVSSTTTVSNIITAASGYTIASASYKQWGKVAQLTVEVKKTAAVTSRTDVTIGTLVNGNRPASTAGLTCPYISINFGYIKTDGTIHLDGTWNANDTKILYSTYILP